MWAFEAFIIIIIIIVEIFQPSAIAVSNRDISVLAAEPL
jgi:hypothetical protein